MGKDHDDERRRHYPLSVPAKILVALLGLAVAEIGLLIWLSTQFGAWTMVYVGLVTGFLGFSRVSQQARALTLEHQEMSQDPARFAAKLQSQAGGMEAVKAQYAERMLGMLGGALLIVPGCLSDVAGLLLSIPALRRRAIARTGRFIEQLPQNPKFQSFVQRQGAKMPGGFPGGQAAGPMGQGPGFGSPPRGSSGPIIDTTASDS